MYLIGYFVLIFIVIFGTIYINKIKISVNLPLYLSIVFYVFLLMTVVFYTSWKKAKKRPN